MVVESRSIEFLYKFNVKNLLEFFMITKWMKLVFEEPVTLFKQTSLLLLLLLLLFVN